MTTSTELRALALKILNICNESRCHSIASPIVNITCDHLLAIARVHEQNAIEFWKLTKTQEDDYD